MKKLTEDEQKKQKEQGGNIEGYGQKLRQTAP